METVIAIIVIGFIIGFPVYFLYLAKPARITNKLHSIKIKKIADVKEGETVRVKGRIVYLGKTLHAPISGRKCVYSHVTVEKERHSSKNTTYWHEIIEDETAGDIIICDGKNYALIETKLINSYIVQDREYVSDGSKSAPGKAEEFLKKHDEKMTDLFGCENSYRYKEGILEENELIAVVGKAIWKTREDFDFKIPVKNILILTSQDEAIYLSDDPFAVSRKIES